VFKGKLEISIYFKKDTPASTKTLVVLVLSNSPWVPRNLKKCPK